MTAEPRLALLRQLADKELLRFVGVHSCAHYKFVKAIQTVLNEDGHEAG